MSDLKIFTDVIEATAKERYYKKIYDSAPMIECKCGCGTLIKSKDRYGRSKEYVNGHNGRKYENSGQYKREWNHRHHKERYEYKRSFVSNRKMELLTMMGGKCKICGIEATNENIAIFDFHHKNPDEKEFNLGQNTIGNIAFEKVKKEAEKCDILCSNCHRLYHFGEGK